MGRKSLGSRAVCLLETNDDESERVERKKEFMAANDSPASHSSSTNFDYGSVINLCSSNKVNVTNTWKLDLIDHLDDVLESQHGSFQKASCTLQASVQIYEKRVDSTHIDTFKMLENVNRTRKDAVADAEANREVRRKANTSVSTFLESNLNAITNEDIEKEYDVDPLFKKMSKTFDAGGARGLLLNNLNVANGPVVVFDTSETMAFEKEQGENIEEPQEEFPPLELQCNRFAEDVPVLPLCPSLEVLHRVIATPMPENQNSIVDGPSDSHPETEVYSSAVDLDEGFIFDDDDALPGDYDSDQSEEDGPGESSRPLPQNKATSLSQIDFTYFDSFGFLKQNDSKAQNTNWAGPSHWKFGRAQSSMTSQGASKSSSKRTVGKKSSFLDFSKPRPVFEMPTRASSINLAKRTATKPKNELPEDLHYTIRDLCKLFLKPVMISEVVRRCASTEGRESSGGMQEQQDDDAGFFDDYDHSAGDDEYAEELPNKLGHLVEPSYVVEKIDIDYATKAKKVDVHQLKQVIWEDINSNEEQTSEYNTTDNQTFCESIRRIAPKISNEEITVPYYFICLLHLANENGLAFEGREDLSDFVIQ